MIGFNFTFTFTRTLITMNMVVSEVTNIFRIDTNNYLDKNKQNVWHFVGEMYLQ